jgi:hypothetical protein
MIHCRLAHPEDAPQFSGWIAANPNIDPADALEMANHTCIVPVIEIDQVAVLFFPIWKEKSDGEFIGKVGFLGFNPASVKEDRLKALNAGYNVLTKILRALGVKEVRFKSSARDEYPMLRWGRTRGMERLDNSVLRIKI